MFGLKTVSEKKILSGKQKLTPYQRIIDHVFRPMHLGRLTMNLPDGRKMIYGDGHGIHAEIDIVRDDFFKKCVLFGDVGFGEAYVDGDWETDDITAVVEWMITNVEMHPTLMSDEEKRKPVNFLKTVNNFMRFVRQNSLTGSRKNISEHYDLGNDFYRLFLDPSMTYSAAYFKNAEMSLEQAQCQKYEELCRKAGIKSSDHVLEIGSGWGGFAIYAAKNFGCRITTVTISQEQFKYAKERISREGLEDQVQIELKDYRLVDGAYDKIVSIEMLEAVGHEYYEEYFRQCHKLLKKDGVLALQVILCPDNRYESFRKNVDWIQKHIFPGSLLPSLSVLQENINQTGNLNLVGYEDITAFYVRTLREWFINFNLHRGDVLALGMDEQFIRKWNYYWCYCMAAFKTRNISVAQLLYTRPNHNRFGGNV